MRVSGDPDSGLSRRELIQRGGVLGAAAVLGGQLSAFVAGQGWTEKALAQSPDLIRDTINGLVAFVVPGPDEYSTGQGESSPTPGAIAAGGTEAVIKLLDDFVPLSSTGATLPASGAVALLLNLTALEVEPGAAGAGFLSPFAGLKFDQKVEVMRRLEELTQSFTEVEAAGLGGGELRFVSGILLGAVAFLCFTEAGVSPAPGEINAEPVGWQITKYDGVAEGRDELKGYYQGRRRTRTARRYRGRAEGGR
jgi:hypothetical protein